MCITEAYQVATLVKRKSQKPMMDLGKDPREGIHAFLRLIVSWLLAMAHRILLFFYLDDFPSHFYCYFFFTIAHPC